MNAVLILFVMSLVVVSHEQSLRKIRYEWRKRVAPYLTQCMCETKVNPDLIEGFFEFGEVTDDPCFKCTVKCVEQATGIMSATGYINKTRYRSFYGVTDEITSRCAQSTHVDLCEKAFEILACGYGMFVAREAANSKNINPQIPLEDSL